MRLPVLTLATTGAQLHAHKTQEPPNTDAVLAAGMFPGLVRAAMRAFDSCNGGDPGGASGAQAQGQADPYRHLTALLKVGRAGRFARGMRSIR
eukprot:1160050-Pelagomonas_calceolata.AAC.2